MESDMDDRERFLLIYCVDKFRILNSRYIELYWSSPMRPERHYISRIEGLSLKFSKEVITSELSKDGYSFPSFVHGCRNYKPSELGGIRLSLLFLCLENEKKRDSIRTIAGGLSGLGDGEAYYWWGLLGQPETYPNTITALKKLVK